MTSELVGFIVFYSSFIKSFQILSLAAFFNVNVPQTGAEEANDVKLGVWAFDR